MSNFGSPPAQPEVYPGSINRIRNIEGVVAKKVSGESVLKELHHFLALFEKLLPYSLFFVLRTP